ncbi:MAG: hypothetical protein GEU94_15390 [Micromonosporaceae bacterium]|nr:hypothetical protein [Micromonosporaceae bacterium]
MRRHGDGGWMAHRGERIGEALVVAARWRHGRYRLADQLSEVGFDVVAPRDADDAWVWLRAWRHVLPDAPRVLVVDASPLCPHGRALFARLAARPPRLQLPLVVLAGAAPLPAAIPGMVVVPLPCRREQALIRVLRAVGLPEARTREILRYRLPPSSEGPDDWLPGSQQHENDSPPLARHRVRQAPRASRG